MGIVNSFLVLMLCTLWAFPVSAQNRDSFPQPAVALNSGQNAYSEIEGYRLFMDKPIFTHTKPMEAYIKGNSCNNITGKISWFGAKKAQYKGKFYCFPYIDNIQKHLSDGKVEYIDRINNEISFKNGPILFPLESRSSLETGQPDIFEQSVEKINERLLTEYKRNLEIIISSGGYKNSYKNQGIQSHSDIPKDVKFVTQSASPTGAYVKVNKIRPCQDRSYEADNSFCVSIDYYEPTLPKWDAEYVVFCWDCKKLRKTPASIQDAILFSLNPSFFALDGGFAVSQEALATFNDSSRYESWHSKLELAFPEQPGEPHGP